MPGMKRAWLGTVPALRWQSSQWRNCTTDKTISYRDDVLRSGEQDRRKS
jgi:hypothetical protein